MCSFQVVSETGSLSFHSQSMWDASLATMLRVCHSIVRGVDELLISNLAYPISLPIDDLDYVITELRLYRAHDLTLPSAEGGLLEFGNHFIPSEPAKVASILA